MRHIKWFLPITLAALVACDKQPELAFETVESARVQVNENAEFNAKSFRQGHPEYNSFSINMRGDSTQSNKCGQGDGWASIELIKLEGANKQVVKLKCSTVSAALGCMPEEDFKSRSYANEEGQCNNSIPFPVPKIQK